MPDDDKELERILGMTEAELRAEIAAEGLDWNEEVAKVKTCFELAVADVEFEKHRRQIDMVKLKAEAEKHKNSVGPKSRWA